MRIISEMESILEDEKKWASLGDIQEKLLNILENVPEYNDKVLGVMDTLQYDGYYTKMGVAWCVATAYAKFPKETSVYLEDNKLQDWTYNKAIQKMCESYRVGDEDKEYWKGRKRK